MLAPRFINPLVEQPLRCARRQHQVWLVKHWLFIDQMHTQNWTGGDAIQAAQTSVFCLQSGRTQFQQAIKWNGADHRRGFHQTFIGHHAGHALAVKSDRVRAYAKLHLTASFCNDGLSGII